MTTQQNNTSVSDNHPTDETGRTAPQWVIAAALQYALDADLSVIKVLDYYKTDHYRKIQRARMIVAERQARMTY